VYLKVALLFKRSDNNNNSQGFNGFLKPLETLSPSPLEKWLGVPEFFSLSVVSY